MQATLHMLTPTVRGFDCGPDGAMHLLRLCNQLQNAADSHARELGVGAPRLYTQGLAWMLVQLRLEIQRMPSHGEKLEIFTWPTGSNRLYAWRQYLLQSSQQTIVRGASAWVVVDISRRAVTHMPQDVREVAPPLDAPEALELGADPAKGEQPANFPLATQLVARHSDLDRNGHINNGVLCQWLAEPALPLAEERNLLLAELAVRFKAEAPAGITGLSQLQVEERDGALSCRHLLSKESDASPLVVGHSIWRPAATRS